MKIKLTETQYNRLLIETVVSDTFNDHIIKIFKILSIKDIRGESDIENFIKINFGFDEKDAIKLTYNYITKVLNQNYTIDQINSLKGEPLEFYGIYKISTVIPTVVSARTYIPGFIYSKGKNAEDAYDNASSHNYIKMEYDVNSEDFKDPDLDFDNYDFEMMKDMVIDQLDMDEFGFTNITPLS